MLKVSGKMLAEHYGVGSNAFEKKLREKGASINNVPDLVRMIIYYELENRQRKDKSQRIIKE